MTANVSHSFKAEYDHHRACPICEEGIMRGQLVRFIDGELAHAGCDEELMPANLDKLVEWQLPVTDAFETAKRSLKLVRPVCPTCFLELPVSMKCGVCD